VSEITIRDVSKKYGADKPAVNSINLDIRDGEFMVLLGPSGCGKSTTLRMIAGLEEISSGNIYIDGVCINDVDPADRNLAIVFQNYALYPHMNVAANLAFGLKLRKVAKDEINRRVESTADILGIRELLQRRPRELSGGQQQRVALGRALVRDPVAFLFDEPLSNLDAKLRATMRVELVKLHNDLGKTIVHVTHDQMEAMTMGDRICIMRNGNIEQVGAPLDVYRNPSNMFVAGFLASPPMNLVDAVLTNEGGSLKVDINGVRLEVPDHLKDTYGSYSNRKVVFGIRPEDIYIQPREGHFVPIDAQVVTVEALGPETILVAKLADGTEFSARLDRSFSASIKSELQLYADMGMMALFDPETEKSIAVNAK